mmetsp:Transcript_59992/g.137535  ORF Transcript_59992/g.137535 Transcript_59992/m.137535 type:complete len:134 (-) Transcript_59992:501-902(-)
MQQPPPPKTFKDTAEAVTALSVVITALLEKMDELQEIIVKLTNPNEKMEKLVPKVQEILGSKMMEYGFPPGLPGLFLGLNAFNAAIHGASAAEASQRAALENGKNMLSTAFMGQMPSKEQVTEILDALKASLA